MARFALCHKNTSPKQLLGSYISCFQCTRVYRHMKGGGTYVPVLYVQTSGYVTGADMKVQVSVQGLLKSPQPTLLPMNLRTIAYQIAYLTLNDFQSHSRVSIQSPVQNSRSRRHVSYLQVNWSRYGRGICLMKQKNKTQHAYTSVTMIGQGSCYSTLIYTYYFTLIYIPPQAKSLNLTHSTLRYFEYSRDRVFPCT